MKAYVKPELLVDNYAADTMIASSSTKNGNPDNNQNCWGCNQSAASTDPNNTQNSCLYLPGTAAYASFC